MIPLVEGPALKALSCGKPAFLVVLLAAPGGDARAMADLALGWAPTMPKADFVTVELPSNGDEAELATALDVLLDEMLSQRRLPDSHLALVGFSEGAKLALRVGLRRRKPIAALVAFSASAYDVGAYLGESRAHPPILLIPILLVHGDADALSPYQAMLGFKAALKAAGAPVWSFKRPGLGHELDDDGAAAAGEFLSRHVIHKAPADKAHQHDEAHP